ncbi:hypothetical protein [Oceanicoccus sp. KOV_DT_Chl]|uniref:hypothetical protein n=1 Tax=Oceanicoccus sp. KOV_DT_Chl TaxID=1904639 RepID=UPI000C7C0BCC|nr:hypothetical protein [Oceanicoccus sp. KOV_DT_Chl]
MARQIDLPLATAIWVLGAHAFTLLSPLILIWAVYYYWEHLQQILYAPELLYFSAVLMMIGSAFEIADNTFDRWYLSGFTPTLCDWLFSSCIVLSLALNVIACVGQYQWLVFLSLALVLAFSIMYLFDWPKEIARGSLGVISCASLYSVVGDPVVFLPLLTTFLTVYFFGILQSTLAQSMHGFTTIVNAFGVFCLPWAFYNSAIGEPASVMWVITVSTVIVGSVLLLKPVLLDLSATSRKS